MEGHGNTISIWLASVNISSTPVDMYHYLIIEYTSLLLGAAAVA
jgi:hypothetical protein